MPKNTLTVLLLLSLAFVCISVNTTNHKADKTQATNKPLPKTTHLTIAGHAVDILQNDSLPLYNLLVLPGWNYSKTDWCAKTNLCTQALKQGFRLILSEMGKSIYTWEWYPQTHADYKKSPTRSWVINHLILELQTKYDILLPTQKNYIMGLSTGAHGAALVVQDLPHLFNACALLSGDYAPERQPYDKVYIAALGPFQKFRKRWTDENHVSTRIDSFLCAAYISHGANDGVISPSQSVYLHSLLRSRLNEANLQFALKKGAGHNYIFWGSETEAILKFFKKH
jgi:predicted esterase